ncbi:AP-1 complex subunit sigma-2 [Hibiscus syriacus]|uniref:AP-1 complex subunit sigma-2 n=1 Tax=Hibiscus syriacus TaxID=106335 RepID=A0A6A2WMQ8_HIBSY|nr:AP-1 complex subunit sigma-2 [Hibiscus syriacus]
MVFSLFSERKNKGMANAFDSILHYLCKVCTIKVIVFIRSSNAFEKVIRELSGLILTRGPKLCNFVEWRGLRVVYKRYASLYFCMCIDEDDNELEILEIIHHYVEVLARYFGSAYFILDELLLAGELQESNKKTVARLVAAQDSLVETAKD